jgi:hypothetical protein
MASAAPYLAEKVLARFSAAIFGRFRHAKGGLHM